MRIFLHAFVGDSGALFGGRPVAHGMLSAGLIGTVFGRQVPGAVYVSQTLRFRRPVFLGDTVEARVTVRAARARGADHNLLTCDTRVVRMGSAAGRGVGAGGDGLGDASAGGNGAGAGSAGSAGNAGAGAGVDEDVVVEGEALVLAPSR